MLLGAILLGLGVLWSAGSRQAFAASAASDGLDDDIAGTWISESFPAPQWDPSGFQILMNINAGGTLIWSHNHEYGAFGLGKDSTVYGSWVQTGPREISSRQLGFIYTTNGVHIKTGRVTAVLTFSPDFQSVTLQGEEDFFAPDQDPTDPYSVPLHSSSVGEIPFKRLDPHG